MRTVVTVALLLATLAESQANDVNPPSPSQPPASELNNRGVTAARDGRFEEGVALLRQALAMEPGDPLTRKNLSGVLTDWGRQLQRQGHIDRAVPTLQEAIEYDPHNGMAPLVLGDLLYLNRSEMAAAVQLWKRAHGKIPEAVWPSVANRIAQAERDQLFEHDVSIRRTAHGEIRFQHANTEDLDALEQAFEAAYAKLVEQLGAGPPRLTVIVYSASDLRRVYSLQRDWALGFYDGRIRLTLQELGRVHLDDIVAHELAHAFLHYTYGDRLPIWVHEGYAQLQERVQVRRGEAARIEAGLQARALWIPLKWLDRHFQQPSGDEDVARAYLQARLATQELITRYGTARFLSFLGKLSSGMRIEQAYDEVFAPARWARADHGIFD